MLKYFKMYEKDKDNFLYEGKENRLFSGSVVSKMCGMEKSFLVSIARTQVRPYDPNRSTVVFALDYDEGVHVDSLILASKFKRNKSTEFIKVYLYDDADEAKIHADYYQGCERKDTVEHRYYFTLDKEQEKKFIKWNGCECDTPNIIMMNWNNSDRGFFKIKHIKDDHLKDYNVYYIMIDPNQFHVSKDFCNGYQKQVYKSFVDEEFDTIKFFTTINGVYNYINELKHNDVDIKIPWNRSCINVKQDWNYEFKNYIPADVKATSKLYEERKMTIKDIKVNGPATIIFWLDGDKTIVKCQKTDNFDIEKGIIMALCKGYQGNAKHWTDLFDIPYADEIDVEKTIGLAYIRKLKGADKNWYYNYILKWVHKIKGYKFEDEVAALKAYGYSDERIMKCLKTTKGKIREALGQDLVYKKEQKIPAKAKYNENFIDRIKMPSGDEYTFAVNKEETKKVLKDIIQEDSLSEKVIKMFNDGTKIAKIAKSLGISEYFVKKALDEATKPKANPKKAERILKKATKEKIVHKKHVHRTQIDYPDYLDKETCDMVLERTKEKYKDHDKIQYLSELQKYFIMECKREYIATHYGNGYDMYTIAKVLGINAPSVQRIWNAYKSGKEK